MNWTEETWFDYQKCKDLSPVQCVLKWLQAERPGCENKRVQGSESSVPCIIYLGSKRVLAVVFTP